MLTLNAAATKPANDEAHHCPQLEIAPLRVI